MTGIAVATDRCTQIVKSNPVNYAVYAILLSLTAMVCNIHSMGRWFTACIPFGLALAYILVAIGCLAEKTGSESTGRKLGMAWSWVLHAILYPYTFIELYLIKEYHLRYDSTLICLVTGTNAGEAREFLSLTLSSSSFRLCMMAMVVFGIAEWLAHRYLSHVNPFRCLCARILFCLYLAWGFCTLALTCISFTKHDHEAGYVFLTETVETQDVSVVTLLYGLWAEIANHSDIKPLLTHIQDVRLTTTDTADEAVPDIMLVIGESHIKWHTPFYGYDKDTYPLLGSMRDSLLVYNDVITPANTTLTVLQNIFSMASANDSLRWNRATMFPAIFKAAGWDVSFWSNQLTAEEHNFWNSSFAGLVNTPDIANVCFTSRNADKYPFDHDFIEYFFKNKPHSDSVPSLDIIQLMGQHIDFSCRFPEDEAVFTTNDYSDRTDLDNDRRQFVADYDNACRYNDKVLYDIIKRYDDRNAVIIYLSDHGEEVYDYRNHMGREHSLKDFAPLSYRYQVAIPFFVYLTPEYRRLHPDTSVLFGEAVNRPFMIDDIPHLLLFISGIGTEWFDPKKCLIHPDYDTRHHRILIDGTDYDNLGCEK